MNLLARALSLLHRVEDGALITALATMLGFAVLQIGLRNFADAGIVWAEPFLRTLVLWIAMLGAMVATREGHHISIDLLARYLRPGAARIAQRVAAVFAAAVCGVAAWSVLELVRFEWEDGTLAFASVPTWVCQSILPFGFAVMTLRFLTQTVFPPGSAVTEAT